MLCLYSFEVDKWVYNFSERQLVNKTHSSCFNSCSLAHHATFHLPWSTLSSFWWLMSVISASHASSIRACRETIGMDGDIDIAAGITATWDLQWCGSKFLVSQWGGYKKLLYLNEAVSMAYDVCWGIPWQILVKKQEFGQCRCLLQPPPPEKEKKN